MKNYVIALDQGTSSSRAIVFDRNGVPLAVRQKEFTQHFPEPGMVEHDPMEIWATESSVMMEAAASLGLGGADIAAIGITNQRETTIVWDAATGKPVCNAIVWQDRRTSAYCDSLKSAGLTEKIREKTGLIIDAYFSGTKIRWILENVPGAREKAEKGELRFGTVDSWLVWNLTGGRTHITDVTNASRNNLLMQFQSDILGAKVIRPEVTETTALGAAYLAGLATGFWKSIDEVKKQWKAERSFAPAATKEEIQKAKAGWAEAVGRTLTDK